MAYQPPFTLNGSILSLLAEIAQSVGRLSAQPEHANALRLRRINRIRTVQGSLAIEGNTLSEEQITAILDGKRIIAPPKDVQEARNALAVYEQLEAWQPASEQHLLDAHALLMKGLIDDAGHYRQGGVGVMKGDRVVHMAPSANRVSKLMRDLLHWLEITDQPPLIASCVFYYEFEFIHPFADGNGRMGERSTAVRVREKVDDDYLSQAGFYAFIKELLELEQRKTRRLLMVTTGMFYWAFRLGIAPMQDLPKLYKNMARSRRLAKIRRIRSKGISVA